MTHVCADHEIPVRLFTRGRFTEMWKCARCLRQRPVPAPAADIAPGELVAGWAAAARARAEPAFLDIDGVEPAWVTAALGPAPEPAGVKAVLDAAPPALAAVFRSRAEEPAAPAAPRPNRFMEVAPGLQVATQFGPDLSSAEPAAPTHQVLFLDIDGVLNFNDKPCVFIGPRSVRPHVDPQAVERFNAELARWGGAERMVFSTSWRSRFADNPEVLRQYLVDQGVALPPLHGLHPLTPRWEKGRGSLTRWLEARGIDPASTDIEPRAVEICLWLKENLPVTNRPHQWIAFDDLDLRSGLLHAHVYGVFIHCEDSWAEKPCR